MCRALAKAPWYAARKCKPKNVSCVVSCITTTRIKNILYIFNLLQLAKSTTRKWTDQRSPRTAVEMRPDGEAEWRAATFSARFAPAPPRDNFPTRWGHSAIFHNARIGSGHYADATNERVSARGARRAVPLVCRGSATSRVQGKADLS